MAVAILVLWFLITREHGGVLIVANSQDQLKDNNWTEIKKWVSRMPEFWAKYFEIQATRIFCKKQQSAATARTATKDNPEAIQGFHPEHALIIFDEASGIPELTFESARGSLSDPNAILVLTGNPPK